jgi:hypothetical protein
MRDRTIAPACGRGADTITDHSGATTVRTGDDTVTCGSRHAFVIVDAGDRVRGDCGEVRT